MAKSLFCAGTTWPGVFTGEDQRTPSTSCARGPTSIPSASAARVFLAVVCAQSTLPALTTASAAPAAPG